MKSIQVFDRPLCCSTGVCGPQVDPALVRFAADLEWLKAGGCAVQRFNLAQEPEAFVRESQIQQLLTQSGVDCLPVLVADGVVVSQQQYPSRQELAAWAGLPLPTQKPQPFAGLAIVDPAGGCCSGSNPNCC